jgi:hypothetical protein
VLNNPTMSVDALVASAAADRDISDLGGNRLQNVIVSLQLPNSFRSSARDSACARRAGVERGRQTARDT